MKPDFRFLNRFEPEPMNRRLLRMRDACVALGISRSTLHRWKKRGAPFQGKYVIFPDVFLWKPAAPEKKGT